MNIDHVTGTNRVIFGNGGEVTIDESGKPLRFEPSEEVATGDHDGYADIVSFDMEEWRTAYGYAQGEGPEQIDILDIGFTTDKGYYEPAIRDRGNPAPNGEEVDG